MNDFDFCKNIGELYQDIISCELGKIGLTITNYSSKLFQMRDGENLQGIEIKHDSKIVKTGNFYFECYALDKQGNKLIKGGILKKDYSWLFITGNGKECWIFSKLQLQLYAKECFTYKNNVVDHADKSGKITSKGVVIPIKKALNKGLVLKHIKFSTDYTKFLEN